MSKKPVHVYILLDHGDNRLDIDCKILGVYSNREMANRAWCKYPTNRPLSVLKFTVKGIVKNTHPFIPSYVNIYYK